MGHVGLGLPSSKSRTEGQEPGEHSAISQHPSILPMSDTQTPWAWPFPSPAIQGEGSGLRGPLGAPSPRVPTSGEQRLGHLHTEDTSVLHMLEAKQRTCGLGRVILIILANPEIGGKKKSLILLQFGKDSPKSTGRQAAEAACSREVSFSRDQDAASGVLGLLGGPRNPRAAKQHLPLSYSGAEI